MKIFIAAALFAVSVTASPAAGPAVSLGDLADVLDPSDAAEAGLLRRVCEFFVGPGSEIVCKNY